MKNVYVALIAVIVITLVGVAAFWSMQDDSGDAAANQEETVQNGEELSEQGTEDEEVSGEIHTVAYDDTNGFSPDPITVQEGDTVVFRNNGSSDIWVASDDHPVHNDLPGFDAESGISPGEEYSYTFEESGTWGYHDHLNPNQTGTVIVE